MYDFMYQYRGDTERIIVNVGQDSAKTYCHKLFNIGLVNLQEWNALVAYVNRLEKLKKKDGKQ